LGSPTAGIESLLAFNEMNVDAGGSIIVEGSVWHVRLSESSRSDAMITCCIQYTLDPHKLDAFEKYAGRWPSIIERCGGNLVGYYLPKEGANNYALALIDFASLADYETYRQRLDADTEAQENFADGNESCCILVESRSFLRRVEVST
jgi:hypothetical protein